MAFPGRRMEERVTQAKARQEASAKMTPSERLAALDERLGVGQGATKERAKLQSRINTSKAKRVVKVADPAKNFVIECDGTPIPIQSISQLRKLGVMRGFDPAPLVKKFRNFKKGV